MEPDAGTVGDVVRRLRAAGCVFAEEEADLLLAQAGSADELEDLVQRRVGGLPLEHVLGWAEFCGLRLAVDAGVFVPRRRTELLVSQAARLLARRAPGPPVVVLDLCCGCGALGVALVHALARAGTSAELHAADLEPAAVACARRNVEAVGGRVYAGDLFAPIPPAVAGRVDLLLANVPYVPTDAIALLPPEARLHEPRLALDGGPDGLAVLRRVAAGAGAWLAPGGHLLVETSRAQLPSALAALERADLDARAVTVDGATAVVGRRR